MVDAKNGVHAYSDAHAAERVFRLVAPLGDADRRIVYEALVAREAAAATGSPHRVVAHALAACAADLGVEAPSAAAYEAWRAVEARAGAPTAAQIRHRCGSWNRAKVVLLGFPEVDPRRPRGVSPRRFAADEVQLALREFVRALPADGVGSETAYRRWAGTALCGGSGGTVAPRSTRPAIRVYGDWSAALHAVGFQGSVASPSGRRESFRFGRLDPGEALLEAYAALGDPMTANRYDAWVLERDHQIALGVAVSQAPFAQRLRDAFGGWQNALRVVLGHSDDDYGNSDAPTFSEEELRAAYLACARDCGHAPTSFEYDAWRSARHALGEPGRLPANRTLVRGLGRGTWSGVAQAVGLELPLHRRSKRYWTEAELGDVWRRCNVEFGGRPSSGEYVVWRAREMATLDRVPSAKALANRLGGGRWTELPEISGYPRGGRDFRGARCAGNWTVECAAAGLVDEALGVVAACCEHLGRFPSIAEYARWRADELEAGKIVPAAVTLCRHLGEGSWLAVHAHALQNGLPWQRRNPNGGPPRTYSDDDLRRSFEACRRDTAGRVSYDGYRRWRAVQTAGAEARVPTARTLLWRLGHGSWRRVASGTAGTSNE